MGNLILFFFQVANSISKIKLASVEIMCPEDYKSDFLNGGEDMVLNTGGKIVAIAITHTAGSYYILLSTKNANKKYPVSLKCSETHYQQVLVFVRFIFFCYHSIVPLGVAGILVRIVSHNRKYVCPIHPLSNVSIARVT